MKTKSVLGSLITVAAVALASVPSTPAVAAPLAADSVQLNGSGATFPQPLYEDWVYTFNQQVDSSVKINYSGGGSSKGKKDIIAGTVDFAGTDAPLTNSEAAQKKMIQIPTVAGAVVVVFNVPGVKSLTFDADTLAAIYLGKIEKWNDPAIAQLNPGVRLPNQTIIVTHRSDGSGTTNIFTTYLSMASAAWRDGVKPSMGTSVDWPADKLERGLGGSGNPGVAALVQKTRGAIGYVELNYAVKNKIAFAKMINAAGNTVVASPASTTAAMKSAWFNQRLESTIANSSEAEAWPIAGFTYLLVNQDYKDCNKATKLMQWIVWGITSDAAKARTAALLYAPLPPDIVPTIGEQIKTVTCNGARLYQ